MANARFEEPKDLNLPSYMYVGDGAEIKNFGKYSVANPHPGFGKDPNIMNEFGHTKYPKWVKGKIANNEAEEAELMGEDKAAWGEAPTLKEDGPTIQEYVAAGYKAKNYPPKGWASKSTPEEIAKAIEEEIEAEAKSSGWG